MTITENPPKKVICVDCKKPIKNNSKVFTIKGGPFHGEPIHIKCAGKDIKYDHFLPFLPKPSIVKRNKNKKTISVYNSLDSNQIPLKVVAGYSDWIDFENKFFNNDCRISLKTIEPFISRAKKEDIQKLRKYYKESTERFSNTFYHFYIGEANFKNPENRCAIKERGGSPHSVDWETMTNIKRSARFLYVYLQYWLKNKLPAELKTCLKTHNINNNNAPLSVTIKIIKKYFNFEYRIVTNGKGINYEMNFYNDYIVYKSLDPIKKALKKTNYTATREPLKSILLPKSAAFPYFF